MLILDTNVISELMRPEPADAVLRWSLSTDIDELSTTGITQAEILYGLAIMPTGKRRRELESATARFFAEKLGGRVLPFDSNAADAFARLRGHRASLGRPMKEPDAQIAAICAVHAATLVTRNVDDFELLGLDMINPWSE